jgi:hypothetical protein
MPFLIRNHGDSTEYVRSMYGVCRENLRRSYGDESDMRWVSYTKKTLQLGGLIPFEPYSWIVLY